MDDWSKHHIQNIAFWGTQGGTQGGTHAKYLIKQMVLKLLGGGVGLPMGLPMEVPTCSRDGDFHDFLIFRQIFQFFCDFSFTL